MLTISKKNKLETPNSSQKQLYTIREAAKFLNISIDTLRRWDKSGKLIALHKKDLLHSNKLPSSLKLRETSQLTKGGAHRYYACEDLELFSSNLFILAKNWAISGGIISSEFHCAYSAVFQARLLTMQEALLASKKYDKISSLIIAITGEIGNNSYDHNLGNWPDAPGVFFGYDISKGIIVLADRGLGILKTLSRVRPSLTNHQDALRVAFKEIISGRAPENRGNGLKFVQKVVMENSIDLFFQSGDAELVIDNNNDLIITKSKMNIQGCLAKIKI